jgi:outer membrane protein assembly factor BamE (lipoprotein component of BamABCDE complex)
MKTNAIVLASLMGLAGCAGERREGRAPVEEKLTLGSVQRDIRPGMGQDEVATRLGAPNIVSGDVSGKETWIYDKVASESRREDGGMEGGFLFFGGYHDHTSRSHVERTLTVVVKFDAQKKVESANYHSSEF